MTAPVLVLSIVLVITSLLLTAAILVHKSRGGGMSDLFGGGMSTAMGGTSIAERNLDRVTIVVALLWFACIVVLLFLYKWTNV
ncbi:MAG: preprotein translocase subunit SecG [Propionibacteriaceae bacterium]|jgi:preprotein translocase subunit SecG|nr:preprotein translocase subunit SecG [Propionibacteriaceae bacterium]